MSMSPEKWTRVKAILMDAMELPTRERMSFVTSACGSDADLRDEVASLLEADAIQGSEVEGRNAKLFDPPQATPGSIALPGSGGSMLVGKRLGRYTITRLIGMGGMGAVYEARQDGLPRPVALKVMRAGLISQSARSRFEREAQVLARLEHPGVARIYDSGVHQTELGPIPFFAMELIAGAEPISEHARRTALGIRERVEMFAGVCDALHYGHQRGIIHRDLKPTNILVGRPTDGTGSGGVKVIDFGIARSTDADMTLATIETARDAMAGTLAYMSPEQCAHDPADIDIRSDVYGLGVVLYELLTGKLPYDVIGKPLPEAVQMIQLQPPVRPSIVEPRLEGDLSVILLKCLAKERDGRYDSAAELAADLRRWLESMPISARPASRWYLLRMFARRHRSGVWAASAVSAAIIVGLVSTSIGFYRAVVERDRAKAAEARALQEKGRAQRVTEFLQGVLRATSAPVMGSRSKDPTISPLAASMASASRLGIEGRPGSLREIIVRVRAGLDAGAMNDPRLEAELRLVTLQLLMTQSSSTREIADVFSIAPGELRSAAGVLGWSHDTVLATGIAVAGYLSASGNMAPPAELLAPLYDAARRDLGPGDVRTLEIGRQFLAFLSDERASADRVARARQLVSDALAAHGEVSRPTLACRLALAQALSAAGDTARAAEEGRAVISALGERASDADELLQGALTLSIADIAVMPPQRDALDRLLSVHLRVLKGVEQSSGGDPRALFDQVGVPLVAMAQLGELSHGIEIMREIARASEERFGPAFHVTTKSKSRVARLVLWTGGDPSEARRLAEEAFVDGSAATGTPLGDYEVFDQATILDARRAQGEFEPALVGIDTLIADYRAISGGHLAWFGGYLHMIAAQSLEGLGRNEEAVERWRLALREIDASQPPLSVLRIIVLRSGTPFMQLHAPEDEAGAWRSARERLTLDTSRPASARPAGR
ncbi:MAG: serine/threonine protein kinase [Phycisphaerales bacterium]|nr:serine/threonine protein kinase [Phycisphaerales bacterium]